MKIEEAGAILKKMYHDPSMGKAVAVHLFGIRHARELDGMPLKDVVAVAGISDSYHTEIRKGMNLAEYVAEK